MTSDNSSRKNSGPAHFANSMSFMGHLEELRRRLLRSLLLLTIVVLGTYAFRKDILDLIRQPVEEPLQKYTSGLVVKPSETEKPVPSLNSLNCVCHTAPADGKAAKPPVTESEASETPKAASETTSTLAAAEKVFHTWLTIARNTFNDFVIFFKSLTSDEPIPDIKPLPEKGGSEEIVLSDSGVINLSCACKPKADAEARSGSSMVYIGLPELFFAQMKAAIFAGLFLVFPYFLIEIWGFVGPALYRSEKKIFWLFAVFSYFFFIGGALFGYFVVFPFGFDFFLSLTQTGEIMPSLSIGDYLSLSIKLLLAFGFIFELPLIAFILARLGVITPELMIKQARIAILVIFITSAMLTPPDPFTMVLMSGPLILLYVISIGVCFLGVNRQKAAQRAQGISDEDLDIE